MFLVLQRGGRENQTWQQRPSRPQSVSEFLALRWEDHRSRGHLPGGKLAFLTETQGPWVGLWAKFAPSRETGKVKVLWVKFCIFNMKENCYLHIYDIAFLFTVLPLLLIWSVCYLELAVTELPFKTEWRKERISYTQHINSLLWFWWMGWDGFISARGKLFKETKVLPCFQAAIP